MEAREKWKQDLPIKKDAHYSSEILQKRNLKLSFSLSLIDLMREMMLIMLPSAALHVTASNSSVGDLIFNASKNHQVVQLQLIILQLSTNLFHCIRFHKAPLDTPLLSHKKHHFSISSCYSRIYHVYHDTLHWYHALFELITHSQE